MINPTALPLLNRKPERESEEESKCRAQGGTWDAENGVCILPKPEPPKTPEPPAPAGSVVMHTETGRPTGFINSKGQFVKAGREDIEKVTEEGALTTEQFALQQRQLAEGQRLSGQIGQFDPLEISPTGLDPKEAFTTGIVNSIPSALKLGVTGAGIGLAGGATVGAVGGPIGAGGGAAIGAAAGFAGGIASGMIGNFKSQRTDTTTAQQRILDEGKQTMKDWATLARNDPANKALYLGEYNKQSAQIDQAYRQMKLDTSKDLAKFETALPNLAEFESFYSDGGERDTLDTEMRTSLLAVSPENYEMLELAYRRKK